MKFFFNPNISETIIRNQPFHLEEIDKIHEKVINNLNIDLKIPHDVFASLKVKDELNPSIFKNNKLIPKIKTSLSKIANDFFISLEAPANVKIKDILLVGSLANYNWGKFSDIDLHIVIDYNQFKDNDDFIKKHFDAEKNLWNNKHKVKIEGFPVEIYVQDIKEKLYASAIYSIKSNKWITEPDKEKLKIDKTLIKRKVKTIFDKIKDIQNDYQNKKWKSVIKKCNKLKDEIKKRRKAGLEDGGEYSTENLIFKILRRTDIIELIDSLSNKAYDANASITEDLHYPKKGDKIIPYDDTPEIKYGLKGTFNKTQKDKEEHIKEQELTLKKVKKEIIESKVLINAFKQKFKEIIKYKKDEILSYIKKNKLTEIEADNYTYQATSFNVSVDDKIINGNIPLLMVKGVDFNNNKVNWELYFDSPTIGDGLFNVRLSKRYGIFHPEQVRNNPNRTIDNLSGARDIGYSNEFHGDFQYYTVQAGIAGKYQGINKPKYDPNNKEQKYNHAYYFIFNSPAYDAVIKTKFTQEMEILDFINPSNSYTNDNKGSEISNQKISRDKKLEAIRSTAEVIINFPLQKSKFWIEWKINNIEPLSDDQFKNLNVTQTAEKLAKDFQLQNPNKTKKIISISNSETPEQTAERERLDREKEERIQAARQQLKNRKK